MKIPKIYEYFNYRLYLGDVYTARKSQNYRFSYRSFAKKAGYNSSGLYANIVKGRNNLTEKLIPQFAMALELNEKETRYFKYMVEFTHCRSETGRNTIFNKMITCLPKPLQRLKNNQKEFYANWYNVALHQALSVTGNKGDAKELAQLLSPPITVPQAKHGLELLKALDLVKKDHRGCLRPKSEIVIGGEEIGSVTIHNFQNQMMDLAKTAQERFSKEERHIITQTFAMSRDGLNKVKDAVENFRHQLINIIQSDPLEEQVFQLNLQIFPLTKVPVRPGPKSKYK